MALKPLRYTIPDTARVPWTAAQEKSISHEFPLNVQNESCEDFVARTYFQFLWLPESIMPLNLLVPSLLRVQTPDATRHAMLERLLLTTRSVTNKYHVELPYILANGGGQGEEEESIMWFAVTHEKSENEQDEDPWLNDSWRSKWMDRMERREVQVQILLYLLKLSLPGLPDVPLDVSSPSKKRRKIGEPRAPSLEDRLEAFMDKLSMWQLVNTLDQGMLHRKEDRDWMQVFCEDVVEPRFGGSLPAQIELLRSKIFPHSPFSDSSDSENGRATSPDIPTKRARGSSILEVKKTTLEPARSRSRSLSVTLAEEREREREGSVGARKRLNREVSMKRAFKPRERDKVDIERKEKEKAEEKLRAEEARLVAMKEKEPSLGVTLVDATPVKSRTAR
ncbi:hypothetical protein MSAN_01398500 [Mycena sanguinolenta]|uniref:DNA replication regulator Sld3 C-terminal domain-containing protein n=1 Tax=Mycena sanguinolenta TaxID=230812 RepID=A0A8H6Y9W6_9AGAR|nr:hypothetical protein MSAN_01398500 [Mycena sanguinolenta]